MIHLFGDWYLDADEKQFILREWDGKMTVFKDGSSKNIYKSQRFYAKFKDVLEKLEIISQRRSVEESSTLEELGKKLDETKKIIEDIGNRMWPTIEDAAQGLQKPCGDVPYRK